VVGSFGGNIVRVRDVAEVSWATEEATYLGWYNGERAAFVTANQKEGQNVFKVRDGIFAVLDQFEERLPADIRMERAFDQSISVAGRLNRLYLERGDLRLTPSGVEVHDAVGVRLESVPVPTVPRSEVIDELWTVARQGSAPLHSGAWSRATLEVCLAILASHQSRAAIMLGKQVALPI